MGQTCLRDARSLATTPEIWIAFPTTIERRPKILRLGDKFDPFMFAVIRSSIEPALLLSCTEYAPHLFCKLGKNLGQNAVGSTVAIFASRLFHVCQRRILARLGQSDARPDRTHHFLGFDGWRDRCCLRLLLHACALASTWPGSLPCGPGPCT